MPEAQSEKSSQAEQASQNAGNTSDKNASDSKLTPDNEAVTGEGTGSAAGGYGGFADKSEEAYPTSDQIDPTKQ